MSSSSSGSAPPPPPLTIVQESVPDVIRPTILERKHRVAGFIAIALIVIFALTVLPPIAVGICRPVDDATIDFVKWAASVEVAAMGPVFGFYYSEVSR